MVQRKEVEGGRRKGSLETLAAAVAEVMGVAAARWEPGECKLMDQAASWMIRVSWV